jgi:UDP-N-acetyl-D-glucosamine dehydrogenase
VARDDPSTRPPDSLGRAAPRPWPESGRGDTASEPKRLRPRAADAIVRRLKAKKALVAVVGLGYVGLPLVRLFASKGFRVLGFDIDPAKVRAINAGRSYIKSVAGETVARLRRAKRLEATDDPKRLAEPDAIVICVPTPLTPEGKPDLGPIIDTTATIAKALRPGQLIVLESTTYPGTTREVMLPRLEARGLKAGRDFFLAFSPEREDPGRRDYTNETIPKVVGGLDPESHRAAVALYASAVKRVVEVSSAEVAEAAKLLENIYRCVNIALVNELKMCFDRMGIDIWEVIAAASTKPFGFQPFFPGPGLGGHCIPLDPFYLSWRAKEFNFATRFIDLAGELNVQMPYYVLSKIEGALRRPLKDAKILILGLAYKKDIDDPRESPSFKVIELLLQKGAKVAYHDPFFPQFPPMRHYRHLKIAPVELTEPSIAAHDAVVIVTDHSAYDYPWIVKHARIVVDTRNACRDVAHGREKIVKA